MKILNGDFEILSSGVVSSPNLADTTFIVSENPRLDVVFRVLMSGNAPSIGIEKINETAVMLTFNNPDAMGFGPANPAKVGHLNGRPLFVHFAVNMRGTAGSKDSYSLLYTFYLGAAA